MQKTMPPPTVTVPRLWPGSTVVILGNGPSLTAADVAYCRGRAKVIAVNDTIALAPWADLLYASDARWWQRHHGMRVDHVDKHTGLQYRAYDGPRYSLLHGVSSALQGEISATWQIGLIWRSGEEGLDLNPGKVCTGRHSGYTAINVAVHLGAIRVVLLGFDVSRDAQERDHWFAEPSRIPSQYAEWQRCWPSIVAPLKAAGVEVINCSRRTALKVFPCRPLEEALP